MPIRSELIEIDYGVRSTDITQEFRAAGGGADYHWLAGAVWPESSTCSRISPSRC